MLAHQARFGTRALASAPAATGPAASRPAHPLPTPPGVSPTAGAHHPDVLRPGFAGQQQPPFADPFAQGHAQAPEAPVSSEDESSVEDFGLSESGLGSFVRVEEQDQ